MLQILPCPQCGKHSLIPNQTSLEASIQCPHCQAQLVLGEVLLTQFRSWCVIEDPAELYDANPRKLDPGVIIPVPEDDASNDQLQLVADSSPQPAYTPKPQSVGRSGNLSEYERRRRKQKSPIWSIIPVVFGGLAAVPIAVLILWYGLGKDLGNLGPQVAQYAPWIVPQRFHPPSEPPAQPAPPPRRPPQRGASGFRQFDDVMPPPKTSSNVESATSESEAISAEPQANLNARRADGNPRTMPDQPAVANPSESNDELTKAPTPTPLQLAPNLSSENLSSEEKSTEVEAGPNLFGLIRDTQAAVDELSKALTSESTERKMELLKAAYAKLSQLESALQSFDKQNPVWGTIKGQLQPLAKQIVGNKELLAPIEGFSKREVDSNKDAQSIVVAMVIEVTAAERLSADWTALGKHKLPADLVIEVPRLVQSQVVAEKQYFALGTYHRSPSNDSAPVFRVSYLYPL